MSNVWKLILTIVLTGPGLAAAEGMSLEHIAALQQAGGAVVSPDGSHIAYLRSVPRDIPDEADGPAWRELHVIGEDGSSSPFITGPVNVGGLAWHPDGRRITFLDKRGDAETTRLYSIPVDGGEATELAALETDISGYAFNPDGSRVALLAFEPEDPERETLKEQGFSQVVYEEGLRNRRIHILDLEHPDAEPSMIALDGSIQDVAWSPSGDRMAVKISPRELVDDTLVFTKIRIIDPQGGEIGRIDNPGKLGGMAWSPDGEHLAFIGTNVVNDAAAGRLMVAGKRGGDFEDLIPGLPGHVQHLGWLDDNTIAFVSAEGTGVRLGTIDPDGDNQRTLLEDGPIVSGFSISEGGAVVLSASTPEHPGEIYRFGDGKVRRLTDSNPWLAEVELARQEVVRYSARDGLEIEGVLVYPLNYVEGQRYPLILNVHGGPESHYSNGWLTSYASPAQHAAAEGYFTFFQNYRGSTGRGVDFSQLSFGRPAMEEFDDLIDGVDHLIERGMVDGDRVGITGGSYGGYATAWGATQYTERFAAAVMNVGLSNQIAAFGTSDIPWEFNLVHLGKWPWEDWDLFQQASPLYHVEKAQTPILILHGDADPRVDPTQSRMFYRFLKLQDEGPPVRLVLYPGEGHGNRRAASRYDYSLRLMRWMNHYLKGEGGDPPPYQVEYGLEDLADKN